MEPHDLLKQELDSAIQRLHRDSVKHKLLHRRLHYALFGLTALSTVLASAGAFSEAYRQYLLVAVVVTTALAGLLTSIEGARKPGELWVHERRTHYELVDLRRELCFVSSRATESDLAQLFDRLQAILSVSAVSWARLNPTDDNRGSGPAEATGPTRIVLKKANATRAQANP